MKRGEPELVLTTPPFLRQGETTPWIMGQVLVALVPVVGAAVYYFGLSALAVTAASLSGCLLTEALWGRGVAGSLRDLSGVVTGVLLAMTLPPGFPLWMAFLGGMFAAGVGKVLWGGLGQNLFNPALLGRAFLQAAFPTAITTWSPPGGGIRAGNLAAPLHAASADTVTAATPLALMKFQHAPTKLLPLVTGNTAGSLGETCGLLILLAGVYMAARRILDWRIPVSILLAAALCAALFHLVDPRRYPSPVFTVFSGGLLLGAVFMATDPVTSPTTPLGSWLFGAGIGLLVVLIRLFGGLPEGVMYAILFMNAVTPLLNRVTQPRVYGT